jgi:hypothetical protein
MDEAVSDVAKCRAAGVSDQFTDRQFCSDDDLGYLDSRTRFEAGQALSLDASYRVAHLPLVAPGHPDAIRARESADYRDGRHAETFSLVVPLAGALL